VLEEKYEFSNDTQASSCSSVGSSGAADSHEEQEPFLKSFGKIASQWQCNNFGVP